MLPGLHGNSRLHLENPRLSPSQTSLKTGEPEDIYLVNDEWNEMAVDTFCVETDSDTGITLPKLLLSLLL
jgi:hypothetical protein